MTLPFAAVLFVTSLALVWIFLLLRLEREGRGCALDAAWLQSFSVERYRPLGRMLDESDFRFLASLRGYTPRAGRQLRARRAQAFQGYLSSLKSDFFRLEAFGRALVAAGAAAPGLADDLLRQRLMFLRGYYSVRMQLRLFRWGLTSVDAEAVLQPLRSLSLSVQPAAS